MMIIPAIDLRGGQCVRLEQGKLEQETIYSKDPLFIAKLFQAKGAKRLHIIDLDGAFAGVVQNLEIIEKICKEVNMPVQVGGGMRKMEMIDKVIAAGASKVILGTIAITNQPLLDEALKKYGDKIIVAIDAKKGKISIGGWKDDTEVNAADLAKKMKEAGVKEILYTDISRDGMMEGPNIKGIKSIAQKGGIAVIAAGGISTIKDVEKIIEIEKYGVEGMVIGKALYTETIKLEDAVKLAG
ncbi:MAG: 1-(5-phosphoribosyl)-5-[(5-phosphoribosylamino)methylideneamino]imidazole-4-carboxamide isomerase [bacterium]|jgi:phosphoribosylformimino-5-aminoimidazole carboxamide ribotide isomerase|nr:1-(5-phosphoribosyl)-5-[(5-phosphoribosylamino)methylideneamino]imidazole-4-carboxamide isomerase [bacterium]